VSDVEFGCVLAQVIAQPDQEKDLLMVGKAI
jgi:hypothetical protein